jgi:hypothetical protein
MSLPAAACEEFISKVNYRFNTLHLVLVASYISELQKVEEGIEFGGLAGVGVGVGVGGRKPKKDN